MSVTRPRDRRPPPPPPPPKRQQQQQQQVRGQAKATNNANGEPKSKTASILKLIPEPSQQQRPQQTPPKKQKNTPPTRGHRNPVPTDIESWLDTSDHWQHTTNANAHIVATKARTPLHPRQHPDVAQQQTQTNPGPGKISPLALDPSSSSSLDSSSLASTSFLSSPPSSSSLPPPPRNAQLVKLKNAVQSSREAETLHAYDVGVIAALQSMLLYWNGRADAMQTSSAEKRIFLREAQRLTELIDSAEREMLISNAELVNKQEREERLWENVLVDSQYVSVSQSSVPSGATIAGSSSWGVVKGKEKEAERNDNGDSASADVVESPDRLISWEMEEENDALGWETQEQAAADEEEEKSERAGPAAGKSVDFIEEEEFIDDEDEVMSEFEDVDCPESQGSVESQCSWLDE